MDLLKRCSGSTLCSYARRVETGFISVLYFHGALPRQISKLFLTRSLSTAIDKRRHEVTRPRQLQVHVQKPFMSFPFSSKQNYSPPGKTLPDSIQRRLRSLQLDIIKAILDHQDQSALSLIGQATFAPTNFTRNLQEMAKYYFAQGGKLFRPTVSMLMANVCTQMTNATDDDVELNQYRIAMVSEMIHTASLVHDDVIDESGTRRGKPTVNARWGNRQAVLVGDFILARATKVLCSIGDPPVISTMAEIVEDLVQGELMQLTVPPEMDAVQRFQHYMTKTFYKTASLFANSCKSVAMLAGCTKEAQQDAFNYGRHLGLAFQLVDDMLDYVASSSVLGKPSVSDLRQGLATCPVLYAAHDHPELNDLINRRFRQDGDVEKALDIVMHSRGLEQTKELAKQHCVAAAELAEKLPQADSSRDCLVDIALSQLDRDR